MIFLKPIEPNRTVNIQFDVIYKAMTFLLEQGIRINFPTALGQS
jgi:hypothetical protein